MQIGEINMLNTHRILVAMGNQTFQRDLVTYLNRKMPDHIYDNLISYDFYNVASGKNHKNHLCKVINAEDDYRYQSLFILDDVTPICLSAAWELLPYEERDITGRKIPIKTDVYVLFSSARISKDGQRINKIIHEKEMDYINHTLHKDFERESEILLNLFEINVLQSKQELIIKLQR